MNFLSIEFVILLASTFLLYYVVGFINQKIKHQIPQWSILLIASLIFYGFVNYFYLIYLGASVVISYCSTLFVQYKLFERKEGKRKSFSFNPKYIEDHLSRRKYENTITSLAIIINVGIIATLKYFNFFSTTINSIFNTNLVTFRFIIPLGISFYTFSLIAYNVDCCQRKNRSELNLFKFILFVSYFPKILQGPISSYETLKKDGLFDNHIFSDGSYLKCVFRISIGLIKKVAIANVVGLYIDGVYSNITNTSSWLLVIVTFLYSIQLYCDFSGFLDMTLGISGLFGIKLEENFNIPYISSSIQEFWRRWHITLGVWLKKYIYIPLGGNRVPLWRWVLNTFIVWLVSGIWHGANWTFVVWGLFHGFLLVINGLPNQIRKKKGITKEKGDSGVFVHYLNIAFTFLLVNLGWVFFRSNSIEEAGAYIYRMITIWKTGSYNPFIDSTISSINWLFPIAISLLVLLAVFKLLLEKKNDVLSQNKIFNASAPICMFVVSCLFISFSIFLTIYFNSITGGESSFIYFDF